MSELELVEGLKAGGFNSPKSFRESDSQITTLKGYIKGSEILMDRIRNTNDLVRILWMSLELSSD